MRAVSSNEVYPPATGNVKPSSETSRQGRAEAGRWGRLSLGDIKEQLQTYPQFLGTWRPKSPLNGEGFFFTDVSDSPRCSFCSDPSQGGTDE